MILALHCISLCRKNMQNITYMSVLTKYNICIIICKTELTEDDHWYSYNEECVSVRLQCFSPFWNGFHRHGSSITHLRPVDGFFAMYFTQFTLLLCRQFGVEFQFETEPFRKCMHYFVLCVATGKPPSYWWTAYQLWVI